MNNQIKRKEELHMSKYQISEQEHLFNEIIDLKHSIQSMASIVQNPMELSEYQLNEWNEDVNVLINKINSLKLDVLEYYGKR